MWLPRQERHLLMAYEVCIPGLTQGETLFSLKELAWFATYSCWIPLWGARQVRRHAKDLRAARDADHGPAAPGVATNPGSAGDAMKKWLAGKDAVEVANKMLQDRRLVNVRERGTDFYGVTMVLEGRDLGRKYNSWFDCGGLWFREYKDHWVWLIVSFLGGVLGALIVQWLSN